MKIFIAILFFSFNCFSHSGRTNSSGCHNNTRTGGYHCHNSRGSSVSSGTSSSSSDSSSSTSSSSSNDSSSSTSSSSSSASSYNRSNTGNEIYLLSLVITGMIVLLWAAGSEGKNTWGFKDRKNRAPYSLKRQAELDEEIRKFNQFKSELNNLKKTKNFALLNQEKN